MTVESLNWLACWVCLGIGVGLGMFIAAIFAVDSHD